MHATLCCVMRTLLALACLVASCAPIHATSPDLPPPPAHYPHSEERGKSPDEIDQLIERYNQAHKAWHDGLTPEQQAAYSATFHSSYGRPSGVPSPGQDYDWHTSAKQKGLTVAEIARLDRDKLLLEDISLRQSFEAYSHPQGPVFITSDSALNAFHVLFEDSFRELELRRAFTLRTHLENVVQKARELLADRNNFPAAELAPGWRHAQLVVGPALRLLGTPAEFFDAGIRDEIEQQVAKIRAATTVELPSWLAPASNTLLAIDYRRCRPVGFYTDTESLQNYFRAVRWLQSVPFRADRDDELTSIGLLGFAVMEDRHNNTESFFRNYATLFGRPDDPSLPEAAYEFQNFLSGSRNASDWKSNLIDKRRWLLRRAIADDDWKKLNGSLRLPPDAAEKLAEIQFRVLSAYRLPDSLALAQLSESGRLPSGLAVAALLGSGFARHQLKDVEPAKLEAALAAAREDWHPMKEDDRRSNPSLYNRYLDTLAALHAPAEPDAPSFMRGEAWAAKSCLTTLASWAQMRHTFTLQQKETAMYAGMMMMPSGFVEPCPEFFRLFADLVDIAKDNLESAGTFEASPMVAAEEIRATARKIESLGFHLPGSKPADVEQLPRTLSNHYIDAFMRYGGPLVADHEFYSPTQSEDEFHAAHRALIAHIRTFADDVAAGKQPLPTEDSSLGRRWAKLATIAHRLEAMSHKQLRKRAWTSAEDDSIRAYGKQLALVHGYFGNSWHVPRDDAPRWASVVRDPNTDTQLAVGVGRARLIHVLYPYGDGEVLCTGAVMSYYEYPESGTPLTDSEWRAKLDSPAAPALPAWILPYLAR